MSTNLQQAQQLWATALNQLALQMTKATFDFTLRDTHVVDVENDTYQIGVPNPHARDWLENRLRIVTETTISQVAGQSISVVFIVRAPTSPDSLEEIELDDGSDAAKIVAASDYYAAYYKTGGSGYSQLAHHVSFFWVQLLGRAFPLWNYLVAQDKRSLKNPVAYWTPPQEFTFADLVQKMNRIHPRYISGGPLECHKSVEWRKAGNAMQIQSDCCNSPQRERMRFKPCPGGLQCYHWRTGLLEVLAYWKLVVVELNDLNHTDKSYKFTIQAWRMLPILTPAQCRRLTPTLQNDYRAWLRTYGHLVNIPDLPAWESIGEHNLVPLMPIHDQSEIKHNFEQRSKRQEFLDHSIPNPHYSPYIDPENDDDDDT